MGGLTKFKFWNDMKNKIIKWVFSSKFSQFATVFIISVLIESIFLFISIKWFYSMVLGSFWTSIFMAVFSKQKRWL